MPDKVNVITEETPAVASGSSSDETPSETAATEETRPLSPTAAPTSDFITTYVEYADVIEAPREAHEAIATQLLATALNPKVYIQHGALKIPLDLWLLLLSGSGFGRNTLVELARPVLEAADMNDVLFNTTWGSRQAFYQRISERPSGLFVWPELAIVLNLLRDNRFSGVKEWLTDRYDNWATPESIRYRQTGRSQDTPPIEFTQAPRINIVATSSTDWFIGNLSQDDTTGGFVPRWILMRAESSTRLVPIPGQPERRLIPVLAEHLKKARQLEGAADMSAVQATYTEWYTNTHQRFSEQPYQALAMPFFNRLRTHVLKLALIYEVSRSLRLQVSTEAMERSFQAAKASEESILALLPTGMNREGAEVDRMAHRVAQSGTTGLLRSELTRAFQHIRASDRDNRLRTLVEGGLVARFYTETSGRSAEVLVHRDHVAEHTARFPDDRQS
jgi:hypothetical protein